jgi:hypothetical protein
MVIWVGRRFFYFFAFLTNFPIACSISRAESVAAGTGAASHFDFIKKCWVLCCSCSSTLDYSYDKAALKVFILKKKLTLYLVIIERIWNFPLLLFSNNVSFIVLLTEYTVHYLYQWQRGPRWVNKAARPYSQGCQVLRRLLANWSKIYSYLANSYR